MRRFSTIWLWLSLLCTCYLAAQQTATTSVPNLIRYTGKLTEWQGAASATPTTVGVTFAIYKQQDGGAPVWQETQNVTPDAGGQFSILLGSATASGLPDNLFSQQEQRWLGVQMQGQEEQARVLMVSVPYALKAHEADTLGGLPASAFMQATSSSAAAALAANGTSVNALAKVGTPVNRQKNPDNNLPPAICTPVPGRLILWDSQGSECPSSLFQNLTNGNVGINNTAPSTALDVNGIINAWKWYDINKLELAFAGVGFQAGLGGFPDYTKRNTFVGVGAGTTTPALPGVTPITEFDNTFLGYYGGSNTKTSTAGTGGANTFAGSQAGTSNVTGSQNTFVGWQAGFSNTVDGNTFLGAQAGFSNVSGIQNTFTGWEAGYVNLANNNTFYGWRTGFHNSTGAGNTFLGLSAGFRNDTGNNNTYLGFDSGWTNSGSINNNTFTGWESGFNNSGNNGSFYGYQAGYNNTANGNSFFGYNAGMANTSGDSNTFLGNLAGTANTSGKGNTFVGDLAGTTNVSGNYNTFSGQNAGKNDTVDGNSFYGYNSGTANTTGIQNTFVGYQSGLINAAGHSNTFLGYNSGQGNNADYNTFVGTNSGFKSNAGGNTLLGYAAGSNTIGSAANGYGITATGYDAGRGNVNGTLNAYFGVNTGFCSDANPENGSNNTYLGNGAGSSCSMVNGSNNIFVGFAAGNAETTDVNNNIEIGNSGPTPTGSNTTVIGSPVQQHAYLFGIEANPPTGANNVFVDVTGRLYQGPGIGGGVTGNCTPPTGGNYIAQWFTMTSIGCSGIFVQNGTNYIGIGTLNPSKELDVNGVINAQKWYDIGEPETPVLTIGTPVNLTAGNLFVGIGAGTASSSATQNTFTGYKAGTANTANGNVFYGANAGLGNTSGAQNTFLGLSAGNDNTTGGGNTYVGWEAGFHGAPGTGTCCNTFVGNGTGFGTGGSGTLTGAGNSYFGHRAGEATTSGAKNVFSGYWSGLVNTSGTYNAFYGSNSGQNNIGGSENTYLGAGADSGGSAGSNNIHVGFQAGSATANGGNNIEIGNLGAGTDAGYIRIGTIGTHVNNTYIAGFAASTQPPNVYYNTATGQLFATTGGGGGGIGPCAMGANYLTKWTSSTMVDCSHVWENPGSPYFVGIGTTTPVEQLDVRGEMNIGDPVAPTKQHYRIIDETVLGIDGTNNLMVGVSACPNAQAGDVCVGQSAGAINTKTSNTFVGFNAGLVNATGRDNTFVGTSAGSGNTGTGNIFIGQGSAAFNIGAFDGNITIGNAGAAESDVIRIGSPTVQNATYIAGIFGESVGSNNFTVCVDVNGQLGTMNCSGILSSRRFKDNINDMGDRSSAIFQLRPVTYFYKPQYDDGAHHLQYGLVAEEVAKVYPEMVVYDNNGQPQKLKYDALAPMLLNEVQKLHARTEEQAELIATQQQELEVLRTQLREQNASFEERFSHLESLVNNGVTTAAAHQTSDRLEAGQSH